jgi:hypothetical protein
MRRALIALCLLSLAEACGFGFADDTGAAEPSSGYWGWTCADGTTPAPDAGCPQPDAGD